MKDNEINEKLARLDGLMSLSNGCCSTRPNFTSEYKEPCEAFFYKELPDYCDDLNLLMPLAWKHGVSIVTSIIKPCNPPIVASWISESEMIEDMFETIDPKQAIIQCLLKIAEENE